MRTRLTPSAQANGQDLLAAASVLAVVAHPDDESFGLGAVLDVLIGQGATVGVICLTHGEASSLGTELLDGTDLHTTRRAELADAALQLGLHRVELHDFPDGHLSAVPLSELADLIVAAANHQSAELLVVFDRGGITGHADHIHATEAALAAAGRLDLPVMAWAIRSQVADQLNTEFGAAFAGRADDEIDRYLTVDRTRQVAAIACHHSQSATNHVLWRRLELTGPREPLRFLRLRTG
jgi:LmbE family N-acetylglucosaminyl deacetylase